MFAEHLSELVSYQLEIRQSVWPTQQYLSSNAVRLINPKILLLDVMLKQSGVKAKKIQTWSKSLVTGTPHRACDWRRNDDDG